MGRIISALMAIYIPFIGHEPNAPAAHINSRNVWLAAQTFASETEQYSSSNSNLTLDQFEEKWITYRHVLMMQLGSEYIIQIDTLMKLAARVRWQYIGRTLSVVRMWQVLAECLNSGSVSPASIMARGELLQRYVIFFNAFVFGSVFNEAMTRLLDDTVSEFNRAAIDVDFFSDPSSLDAVLAARGAAYASLVGRIGIEIKKYPSGVQKWDNLFNGYRKGAEDDAEHVRQLRQFAAANSQFMALS